MQQLDRCGRGHQDNEYLNDGHNLREKNRRNGTD